MSGAKNDAVIWGKRYFPHVVFRAGDLSIANGPCRRVVCAKTPNPQTVSAVDLSKEGKNFIVQREYRLPCVFDFNRHLSERVNSGSWIKAHNFRSASCGQLGPGAATVLSYSRMEPITSNREGIDCAILQFVNSIYLRSGRKKTQADAVKNKPSGPMTGFVAVAAPGTMTTREG